MGVTFIEEAAVTEADCGLEDELTVDVPADKTDAVDMTFVGLI